MVSEDVIIVAAGRTAVGSFGGTLAQIPATSLGAKVIAALLQRSGVKREQVDEVIMGQILTGGAGQNPARQAVIEAGLPVSVPSMTINKACGSELKSVHLAIQAIRCGDRNKIIAQLPVGRLGVPEEVAYVVECLASEEAAFITGADISINGGQYMT